jgi:LCP family protein required for cell wall assembly
VSDQQPPQDLAPSDDSDLKQRLAPRHGRLKRRTPWAGLISLVAIIVAVALVSSGGIATVTAVQAFQKLGDNNGQGTLKINDGKIPLPPTVGAYPGGFNILIVGSDTRVGQGGVGGPMDQSILNDVTMLLHVSGDHTNATAVSFPRDMVVPMATCSNGGGGLAPINTALYDGGSTLKHPGKGLPCAVSTVEKLTGLKVQFAGLITFRGVVDVTDAIGGVPVCVTANIHDKETGLSIKKGTHIIKGVQALQFLRSRHGVGDGSDLGRISSQQVYLSSLVRQIKSNNTLSDIPTLYRLAQAATRNMQLSQGFASVDTLFAIATALKNIPTSQVIFTQYPGSVAGTGVYAGKVQPLTGPADALFRLIKADKPFRLESAASRGSVKQKHPKKVTSTSTATATPTATSTSPTKTSKLPVLKGIIGQSSAEYTCSKAYTP